MQALTITPQVLLGDIRRALHKTAGDVSSELHRLSRPHVSRASCCCRAASALTRACSHYSNVVESALARHVLNTHLVHLGIGAVDGIRTEELDSAFNELWANNGDAISRLYAGTSALKGDFVRCVTLHSLSRNMLLRL